MEETKTPQPETLATGQTFRFAKSGTEYIIGKNGEARRASGKLLPKKLRNKVKTGTLARSKKWGPGRVSTEDVLRNRYEYQQQRGSIV